MAQPLAEDVMHAPHPTRTVAAHTISWFLVGVAIWDGAGYTYGGPRFATSQSFTVIAAVPGGMRTWGVLLLLGALAVAWGIGRDGRGHNKALNTTLTVGVAYYLIWSGLIIAGWFAVGGIPAWGALSKSLLLAALYYACARAVAPPSIGWADHVLAATTRTLRNLAPTRNTRGQE